ncbi:MAG: phenylacetate--CoA ligase family protein, partial [Planctomycetia bacterium]
MTSDPHAAASVARQRLDAVKLERLRGLVADILPHNRFYAAKLARVSLDLPTLDALADWPFTFKEELVEAAAAAGGPGNLTWPRERYVRFHQTSGTHGRPLPVFDTAEDWAWWMACWEAILDRGGVRAGDRVLVASSFGPYAGFWSCFDAVLARRAMAIPTGGMATLARLELARSLGATVLVATPSYALHLAEVAAERKFDLAGLPVRLVIVAGEPGGSVRAVRARIEEAWGAAVLDHAGATEVGPWGVGDLAGRGLEVIEPWFHAEFLGVETGRPAGPGELAELVLTTLGRTGAPVIRYRTGDLVRPRWPTADEIAAGACPWVRLEGGIVGRADDMLVVRGVNIFPGAIDGIVRSFPEIVEYRLTATTRECLDVLQRAVEDRLNDPDR